MYKNKSGINLNAHSPIGAWRYYIQPSRTLDLTDAEENTLKRRKDETESAESSKGDWNTGRKGGVKPCCPCPSHSRDAQDSNCFCHAARVGPVLEEMDRAKKAMETDLELSEQQMSLLGCSLNSDFSCAVSRRGGRTT